MELKVHNEEKALKVNKIVFDTEYNEGLVHQVVVAFMNRARAGTVAQKTRAEVRGGGRKPWKQKGTGRARAGTIRSPLWRSGGVIFAAKPRDYSEKVNKKMYRGAMRAIVSELYRQGNLSVVKKFECKTHKTKEFIQHMKDMALENALIVMSDVHEETYLAARNVIGFDICDVRALDPVSLLRFKHVVMTEDAVKELEERLQ